MRVAYTSRCEHPLVFTYVAITAQLLYSALRRDLYKSLQAMGELRVITNATIVAGGPFSGNPWVPSLEVVEGRSFIKLDGSCTSLKRLAGLTARARGIGNAPIFAELTRLRNNAVAAKVDQLTGKRDDPLASDEAKAKRLKRTALAAALRNCESPSMVDISLGEAEGCVSVLWTLNFKDAVCIELTTFSVSFLQRELAKYVSGGVVVREHKPRIVGKFDNGTVHHCTKVDRFYSKSRKCGDTPPKTRWFKVATSDDPEEQSRNRTQAFEAARCSFLVESDGEGEHDDNADDESASGSGHDDDGADYSRGGDEVAGDADDAARGATWSGSLLDDDDGANDDHQIALGADELSA
jgi:hypothetical protein